MRRFLMLVLVQVMLWVFLVPKVLAVPGTPSLYNVNNQTYSPWYSTSTTASLYFGMLTVGNTLMVFDNSTLVREVGIGATRMTVSITGLSEASHQFNAMMIDSVGETGPISDTHVYVVDLTPPDPPILSSISGGTSPEESSSNSTILLVTGLEINDFITVLDGGSTIVTNILAVGSTAVVNLSAVPYGAHNYKVTSTDRAGNISSFSNIFVYTKIGTNQSVLADPRFLGNPLAAGTFMSPRYLDPHYYPRNIWDMQLFDGRIYFGSGNSSNYDPDSNWGPMSLWYYNLGTTSFGSDRVVNQVGATLNYIDEEQVDKLRVLNGTLWTPGHDSQESWTLGNIYRYDGNSIWTKFRSVPDGIHVYDLAYLNGKMYAALGAGDTTSIYESADGGTTWTGVANTSTTGSYRIYDLFVFNNELYGVDTVAYNTESYNDIFKFDGTSFQNHSVLGFDFIPGSSKIVPITGYYDVFRMIRSTEFSSNLLFILANGSNDHQWSPLKLYKTSDVTHSTLINLADGAVPYDIRVDGSTVYVLAAKKLSDTSYINYVFSSTDTSTWNEVLHFAYQTYAISFEKNNSDFYFGMGTGQPPGWMDYYADSTHLSAKAGDVLELKREDYLAIQPVIESINGTIGVSVTGGTMANIAISNLDMGSSVVVYDNGVAVGSKLAVGATDEIIISDLVIGVHPFVVRVTNTGGNSTADSTGVNYTVTPPPTVPGQPIGLGGTAGDGLVNLYWTVPASDGGAAITDYQIEYKLGVGDSWIVFGDGMSVGVSGIVTSLVNDSEYNFRVSAINSVGVGATSETINLTPVAALTPTPTNTPTPTPTPTPTVVDAANISDLITNGTFVPSVGSSSTDTPKITVTNETTIRLGDTLSLTTIDLEVNTEITKSDDQNFNADLISAGSVLVSSVSNFTIGFTPKAAIQWGISGITLVFSKPVVINMYVGTDQNGQTLSVFRSSSTSSGWTSDGIVSPMTCVVTGGNCQFSTTKASYFSLVLYQGTSGSSNSSSSSSSSNSSGGGNSCNDAAPIGKLDLFEIRAKKGMAKLFYTPSSIATGYAILYGFKKGDERFGAVTSVFNQNRGIQSVDIKSLNPKLTYYFKVGAINGCNAGAWSDWVSVQANKTRTVYKYSVIIKNKIKTLINKFK